MTNDAKALLCSAALLTLPPEKASPQEAALSALGGDRRVLEEVATEPELSTFYALLDTVRVEQLFAGNMPKTVLAPVDATFADMEGATLTDFFREDGRSDLVTLLSRHLLRGALTRADLEARIAAAPGGRASFDTVGSERLVAGLDAQGLWFAIGAAEVDPPAAARIYLTGEEVVTDNGVLHQVTGLLKPADGS